MAYSVSLIPLERCYAEWQNARVFLEPAIERSGGRWRNEYVFAALIMGRHQLWEIHDEEGIVSAFTTEFCHYPEKKTLAIHFLGGKGMEDFYADLSETVTKYAREAGCDAIECNARSGFWTWFKHDGFDKVSVFYEKAL